MFMLKCSPVTNAVAHLLAVAAGNLGFLKVDTILWTILADVSHLCGLLAWLKYR